MIYKLKPILKQRIWGGSALGDFYNAKTDEKIGEAWILSCLEENNNPIDDSTTLADLFNKKPDIVAKGYRGQFPILIKLIDAQDNLSIQVHPSTKTEFWHILSKRPTSLYMGLNQDTDLETISNSVKDGSIISLLNNVTVKADDSYLIRPGTIHAINRRTFLIEIQQSADVTYRLYDYDRVDAKGNKRPLHINEALDCIDTKKLDVKDTKSGDQLVYCEFFNVYKHKIDTVMELNATDKSFHAITVLDGMGKIEQNGQSISFKPFETFFIDAGSGSYKVIGRCVFVLTTL